MPGAPLPPAEAPARCEPNELLRLALDCLLPADLRLEPALDWLERRR
jgi:hypothetical protein